MSRAVFAEINARRELEGKPLMANPRERRRRVPAAAGPQDLRGAEAGYPGVQPPAGGGQDLPEPLGDPGLHGLPALQGDPPQDPLRPGGDSGGDRPDQRGADGLPLRHRRGGHQERPPGGPGAGWAPPPKFPKWAVAFKYPPEKKFSVVQDIVVQVGRHRRADAQGGAVPGAAGGHHRHQRHPPQPGLHHREGHPHRGHCAGAEGGGDHPGDFERGLRQTPGGHGALHAAGRLPGVRRPGGPGRGRRGPALHRRGVPGPAAAEPHPLRQPGRPWTSTAAVRR